MASARIAGRGIPSSGGTELRFKCPYCPRAVGTEDERGHLYVHACGGACSRCQARGCRDGFFLCHRCGAKGRLTQGVRRLAPVALDGAGSASAFRSMIDRLRGWRTDDQPRGLPSGYVRISHYMEAWDYLLGRGLTPDDIEYYGIGVGVSGEVSGRVIVPSYDEHGDVVFWTGRTYRNSSVRYINPIGEVRRRALFDLARASRRSEIVITEGVFSAMVAGRNAIATFGKLVTDDQVAKVVSAYRREDCSRIVVALDGDALGSSIKLARRLASHGCRVSVAQLPNERGMKDPADLGRLRFGEIASEAWDYSDSRSVRALATR
jgi:hypothetical protein